MPSNIFLSGPVGSMGFKFTSKEVTLFSNPLQGQIRAVLTAYKDAQLCKFEDKAVDLSGVADGGRQWIVTTPNKGISNKLWHAMQIMDDQSRLT